MSTKPKVLDEEVMAILCKWSKAAVVHCFDTNGLKVDLESNPAFDSSLSSCMDAVVSEILTMFDERVRELGPTQAHDGWQP